jgi:hypothetical protein
MPKFSKSRLKTVNDNEISHMLDDDDDDGIGPMPDLRCLETSEEEEEEEETVEVILEKL